MKRLITAAALLALAIPLGAHASATTVTAPFEQGPRGGDSYNHFDSSDPKTGDLAVLRIAPSGPSGGLGCGGSGGFNNFKVTRHFDEAVTSVTVAYTNAIVDPYTWIKLGVLQGGEYLRSADPPQRGVIAGDGTISVEIPATSGDITAYFGIETASACPNVDGGRATFTSVTFA